MATKNTNIEINRGTTVYLGVEYTKNKEAASLVDCTVYFTLKGQEYDDSVSDSSAILQKNVTVHTDPENGRTDIKLTAQDTWIKPGVYNYDIQVKEPNGDVYELVEGTITIDGAPTNRSTQ